MNTATLAAKYAVSFLIGNDLVVRKATILSDNLTTRAYVARFAPKAFLENGLWVVQAVAP